MFRTPTLALENNPSIKEVIYMMQVRMFLSYCVDFKTKATMIDRLDLLNNSDTIFLKLASREPKTGLECYKLLKRAG